MAKKSELLKRLQEINPGDALEKSASEGSAPVDIVDQLTGLLEKESAEDIFRVESSDDKPSPFEGLLARPEGISKTAAAIEQGLIEYGIELNGTDADRLHVYADDMEKIANALEAQILRVNG